MITRYDSDKLEVIALPQGYQLSEAIKQQIHIIPSNTILLSKTVLTQFCTIKLMLPGTNTHVAGAYLSRSAYQGMRTIP